MSLHWPRQLALLLPLRLVLLLLGSTLVVTGGATPIGARCSTIAVVAAPAPAFLVAVVAAAERASGLPQRAAQGSNWHHHQPLCPILVTELRHMHHWK